MKKRILSLLLALVLVAGLLPAAVTQASAASAGNDWTITVEKYDEEGNGEYLLEPTVVDYYYYKNWVPGIINYYWGNDYSKVHYDSQRNEYYITEIADASQDDGWLTNGEIRENSHWKIVWNNTVLADKPSGCYASRGAVIRYIFSVNGDAAEAGVDKNALLQALADLTAEDKENAAVAAAYEAANAVVLNPDATEEDVANAQAALEAALHPAATGITIVPEEDVTLGVGKTVQLSAELTPAGARDEIVWSVGDEAVATVTQSGLVTGVAPGETYVQAGVNGTELKSRVAVSVERVAATGLTAHDAAVLVGESVQLTADVEPGNATDPVIWTIDESGVAAVTEDGIATGVKAGTATVTATCNGLTSTATLTVADKPYVYFEYADGSTQQMAEDASFTLCSLDEGYFRVGNTSATAWWENEEVIDAGGGSVTYHWYVERETGKWQPSGQQPTKPITVTAGDFTQSFLIHYEPTSGVTELKTYIDGTEVTDDAPYVVTGCISDVAVATKGLKNGEWIDVPVQALNYNTSDNVYYNFRFVGNCLEINRAGNATMTVSVKGESVSTTFKVVCNPVMATAMEVIVPETFEISDWDAVPDQYVGIRPFSEGGYSIEFTPSNATNRDVTWTAMTPEVAEHFSTHSAGIVPKKAGTANFTVTNVEDPSLTQDVTVTFTYKNPLTAASVEDLAMDPGQTQELTINVSPENATEQRFIWTYSREGVVEVSDQIHTSEDGMSYWTTHTIKALKAGIVTVTGTPWDTTGGCEAVTFTVKVGNASTENVTLEAGQSVTYTDSTGDYTESADLSGLNTDVATVALEASTGIETVGWLGSDANYNASSVGIEDCLYTFTKNGDTWTITGEDANGNTVYLYPGNGKDVANGDRSSGYPNTLSAPEGMTISVTEGSETGSFYLISNVNAWDNGKGAYLYFNRSGYTWDRVETVDGNATFQTNSSMYLYRAAAEDETSSVEIPGYVRVTSVSDVEEGQYLIAAPGGNGNYYAAYPSASTANRYSQIARLASAAVTSTKITITGVAPGTTSFAVGATEYLVRVMAPLEDLEAEWPSFRGNDQNNGVTDARTPRTASETQLKWVSRQATGYADAPSPMLLVDDTLVTMCGNVLKKLSLTNGTVVASAEMDAATSYGTTPPLYADGSLFCQLGGGKVQAFNAATLESRWVYTDENGGQAQSPIAYSDGLIYVGFGQDSNTAFVCLDAADGSLVWRVVDANGYYWAGPVVVGDYVIYGSDSGEVVSRNKTNGELISTLEIGQKVRSSICYENGKIYFTAYNARLCMASVNEATGELSGLETVDCSTYGPYSTSTPVVCNGIAYIGVGTWSGSKSIVAVDVDSSEILWHIDEPAYPQCSVLLSTAYVDTGYVYLYVTYNNYPGGVNVIRAKADGSEATQETLYTPADSYQQYCICSVIAGSDGTLYYKNDSGCIFALENTTPETYTVTLPEGEGYTVTASSGSASPVNKGGSYSFTVTILEGYEKTEDFAVKVNGTVLTATEGVYTITDIRADQTVTVEGVRRIPTYTVTLPEGEGYTVTATSGSVSPVNKGGSYSFTVTVLDGYEKTEDFAVKANGTVLTETEGVYTITDIRADQTVTVEGVRRIPTYTVTLPEGEGYTVTATSGSASPVNKGGSYSFTVTVLEGCEKTEGFAVKANGTVLTETEGVYTITDIRADQTVTVEGVRRIPTYTVTLPEGEGYTVTATSGSVSPVNKGGSYSFTVTILEGYEKTEDFAVKVNGTVLTATEGIYTITNIRADQTVTVEGVEKTAEPEPIPDPDPDVPVTSVTLDKTTVYLQTGETVTLKATVLPENATDSAVTWTSSNPKVAAVNQNGKVSAVSVGTATITVTAGGQSASCLVVVTKDSGTAEGDKPAETTGSPNGSVSQPALPFTDVRTSDWFYDAVKYVYENGIMNGTSASKFSPNVTLTRAMVVTILYRVEGEPRISGSSDFADVKAGAYYADAVTWAAQHGIVTGYNSETFGPDDSITREQMAAILFRYAGYAGYDTSARASLSGYTDANQISSYAVEAVQWAIAEGLIEGRSKSLIAPTGTATRAEAAAILMRFCER